MIINSNELLNNVLRFYQETFRKHKQGGEYLQSVGIYDEQLSERFKIGFSNGSLLKTIPSKGEVREKLAELGILTKDGIEYFQDCIIFPIINQDDDIVDMLGIRITSGEILILNNPVSGIFNWQAFKSKEIIFTAGIIEALRIIQLGFDNVIPLLQGLNDHHIDFLKRYRSEKIYLALEDENVKNQLSKLDFACHSVQFPAKPTKPEIEQSLKQAEPIAVRIGEGIAKITDEKVLFEFGQRKYDVRQLDDINKDRLRVSIKAQAEPLFHIDTIDLYSSRSRTSFIRCVSKLYDVADTVIESDLCSVITKMEKIRENREIKSRQDQEKGYQMTIDEETEALEFLKYPDILNQVAQHLEIMGYVGEETNKKLGYLITISRKLDDPLSGVIISRSGAGKSKLMDYLADFVPEEDMIKYTRLTPQALYYQGARSLKHKLLIAGEEEGLTGTDYPIRELISSKKLKLGSPVKDPISGKMKTVEYEVEGPISLLFSTTKAAINYENASRCFTLSLDESDGQTEKIQAAQREKRMLLGTKNKLEGREVKNLHKNCQRLLKKLEVVNPYADRLTFPSSWIETRREHDKYLSLIDAIAFLHQYQREIKKFNHHGREIEYIEVEPQDIAEANKLISEILGTSLDELSRPSKELLKMIKQMVDEKCKELEINQKDFRFNRRDIREYTGWSDSQIKAHIKKLEDLQYLILAKGDRGRMYRYELQYEGNRHKRHFFGLTDPLKLEHLPPEVLTNGGKSVKSGMVWSKQKAMGSGTES